MSLSFLPLSIKEGLDCLNFNHLSEIRLRYAQPVIVEYKGKYEYLSAGGITYTKRFALMCPPIAQILNSAMKGSVYNYAEQLKSGFFTVENGIRIGVAGEYVTENGKVVTIKNATSLNIRIPHNAKGCARTLFDGLYKDGLKNTLICSRPGLGKTTLLRDIALTASGEKKINVLVFDERGEIAAIDEDGKGFDLGDRCDVIRCNNKLSAISGAIRAMKPSLIVTDELYGSDDVAAVKYAVDCGINVIASSHVAEKNYLTQTPFDYFVFLSGIGETPSVYDKNFNPFGGGGTDNKYRRVPFGG